MRITMNGRTADVPDGSQVSIVDGGIHVNGKPWEEGVGATGVVRLEVLGDPVSIKTDRASVSVTGSVNGDVDAGGSVTVGGNVGACVDAGGSVTCGSVGGDVDAGGSVTCGRVSGNVDTGGSVYGI